MLLPMLAISGALYWATKPSNIEVNDAKNDQELIQKELDNIEIAVNELEAINTRHGDFDKLLKLLSDSLADRELRKDFFIFLRFILIDEWLNKYKENGQFLHPSDQKGEWLNPLEWSQFPEFYDVAIQPRLSSDSLDLAFILRLRDKYNDIEFIPFFAGVISIYLNLFATLETQAGTEIYQRCGGIPDTKDPSYYKIRDEVNRELGLQKSFSEILEMINGDSFVLIDDLARSFRN